MAAAHQKSKWFGCDTRNYAIKWAKNAFKNIDFYRSNQTAPLNYPSRYFHGVYACSIWTHFSKRTAISWMDEMRRIIKPGGWNLFTTHAPHLITKQIHAKEDQDQLLGDIKKSGFAYYGQFDNKPFDLNTSDWGFSYIAPDWVRQYLQSGWSKLSYLPGRNQGQDVFVMQRL